MKKLLYITVNPKPQEVSTSKTIGRDFVTNFLIKNTDYMVEELDLYNEDIPEINERIIKSRAELVSSDEYNSLSPEDKKDVDRINALCSQFLNADCYVIAAPMWSISYPSRLKRYIDCIIINNKVIQISDEEVKGLLDDKERSMVYIQSSGGIYPKIFGGKFNHGIDYIHDIFKFLGLKRFEKILVQGIDMDPSSKDAAIKKAQEDIKEVIDKVMK
ncbi:FMN-dependent NADH-azoreductase [Clostridium amazonitimonense]|uniref:FMN-dependent NADH-azoreductase n=1 Tax=Clostridium amazonitimonense TaxID=1499689 RepID=UPI000509A41B|nr:NAD(P)H-dependent oxidoreductase [Clostridium amazonitimonense]